MYSKDDTICAISTPPGRGAIAVIRCSGPGAIRIGERIIRLPAEKGELSKQAGNTLHFCHVMDGEQLLDQVVLSLFRAPHSYSGEDILEISCHGSPYIQKRILELLVQSGARMATAGEFTMRAFLNGKLDLTQVEAIADLIASGSTAAHRVAMSQMRGGFTREIKKLRDRLLHFTSLVELELDFGEEDVEFADRPQLRSLLNEITGVLEHLKDSFTLGNVIKNGIPVAIVGKTNAGKSTLLNLLLSEDRAIVSEIEGTTRDSIEDVISIRGIHFRLIDTAGLRHTTDEIEKLGIERTWQKIDQASIVLLVLDINSDPDEMVRLRNEMKAMPGTAGKRSIIALNKIDLLSPQELSGKQDMVEKIFNDGEVIVPLSARSGTHLSHLEQSLVNASGAVSTDENDVIITNLRHFEALDKALSAMHRATSGLSSGMTGDLLSQDIREAMHYLGEITGEITNDEVLGNIFKNFCIGK
jgi:tRNA modification GTPase